MDSGCESTSLRFPYTIPATLVLRNRWYKFYSITKSGLVINNSKRIHGFATQIHGLTIPLYDSPNLCINRWFKFYSIIKSGLVINNSKRIHGFAIQIHRLTIPLYNTHNLSFNRWLKLLLNQGLWLEDLWLPSFLWSVFLQSSLSLWAKRGGIRSKTKVNERLG